MTEVTEHNILDEDSDIGVLSVGAPGNPSAYAFITRVQRHYAIQSWTTLTGNYRELLNDYRYLRQHRNGHPLVVDVTNVGKHFVQYLRQTGIDTCIPVVELGDTKREPWTFQSSESGLWHVSTREAISILHLLHNHRRLDFGPGGINRNLENAFNEGIEHFGAESNHKAEPRFRSLAIACLIAERSQSVIAS